MTEWKPRTSWGGPPQQSVQQQPSRTTPRTSWGQPARSLGADIHNNNGVSIPSNIRPMGTAIIGKTGTGKSTIIKSLVQLDVGEGATSIVFDAMGDLTDDLVSILPSERILLLSPDSNYPFGVNLYECNNHDPLAIDRRVDSIIQFFRKQMGDPTGFYPRMEYVLRNTAKTIIANPGFTMAEVPLLFHNERLRNSLLSRCKYPYVHLFWEQYNSLRLYEKGLFIDSTLNKLDEFLGSEFLYRIVAQSRSTIHWPSIFASGKVIIVSLPIGTLGEGISTFLGSLLLTQIASNIYAGGTQNKPVRIYLDEFGRYASPYVYHMLREVRRWNVGVTVALQTLSDIPEERMREAVLQMGTLIALQVTGKDAATLSHEFNATPPPGEPTPRIKVKPVMLKNNQIGYKGEREYHGYASDQWYDMIEGPRRLFSDVQGEIDNKLRTLGRFDALIKMPGQDSSVEHHVHLSYPGIPGNGNKTTNPGRLQTVLEAGRRMFGRPWKEIEQEIADRQRIQEPHSIVDKDQANLRYDTPNKEKEALQLEDDTLQPRPRMKPHKARTQNLPQSDIDTSHA